jgi:hypothetical protein
VKQPAKKKPGRGNPAGPPRRGRNGHSTVDQQAGFAAWLREQLLGDPKPTYDDLVERLKSTGFYASRAALHRWGLKFEVRRAEMQILLEKAAVLAQEDPEKILVLEKATSNLAMTRLYEYILTIEEGKLGEEALLVMSTAARLQSSSSSRERAASIASGKFRTAMNALRRALEEKLRTRPDVAKVVLELLEKAHGEVAK